MNHTLRRGGLVLLAAALFLIPAFALAADDQSAVDDDGHGQEVAAEAAHDSPSLFSVDPGLMIWTIVTFIVVLIVLRVTAWTPLMNALAEREKNIEGAIADATRIKNEAESLLAKYETILDQAKDESRSILDEARRDGIAVQDEIRERAQREAEEFKQRSLREIELAKDSALKDIWDEAAGLSTELATRILGRKIDGSDQERLVRELIDDMRGEADRAGARSS